MIRFGVGAPITSVYSRPENRLTFQVENLEGLRQQLSRDGFNAQAPWFDQRRNLENFAGAQEMRAVKQKYDKLVQVLQEVQAQLIVAQSELAAQRLNAQIQRDQEIQVDPSRQNELRANLDILIVAKNREIRILLERQRALDKEIQVQRQQMDAQIAQKQQEIKSLTERHTLLTASLSSVQSEIANQQRTLEQIRERSAQLSSLQSQVNAKQVELATKSSELESITQQVVSRHQEIAQAIAGMTDIKRESSQLLKIKAVNDQNLQQLNTMQQELAKERLAQASSLDKIATESAALRLAERELSLKQEKLGRDTLWLTSQLSKVQEEKQNVATERTKLDSIATSLQKRSVAVATKENEVTALFNDVNAKQIDAQNQLASLNSDRDQFKQTLAEERNTSLAELRERSDLLAQERTAWLTEANKRQETQKRHWNTALEHERQLHAERKALETKAQVLLDEDRAQKRLALEQEQKLDVERKALQTKAQVLLAEDRAQKQLALEQERKLDVERTVQTEAQVRLAAERAQLNRDQIRFNDERKVNRVQLDGECYHKSVQMMMLAKSVSLEIVPLSLALLEALGAKEVRTVTKDQSFNEKTFVSQLSTVISLTLPLSLQSKSESGNEDRSASWFIKRDADTLSKALNWEARRREWEVVKMRIKTITDFVDTSSNCASQLFNMWNDPEIGLGAPITELLGVINRASAWGNNAVPVSIVAPTAPSPNCATRLSSETTIFLFKLREWSSRHNWTLPRDDDPTEKENYENYKDYLRLPLNALLDTWARDGKTPGTRLVPENVGFSLPLAGDPKGMTINRNETKEDATIIKYFKDMNLLLDKIPILLKLLYDRLCYWIGDAQPYKPLLSSNPIGRNGGGILQRTGGGGGNTLYTTRRFKPKLK